MNLEVEGKLIKKLQLESGKSKNGKDWQKQSFVIDTGAQYNPEVCFSCFGKNLNQIEQVKENDLLKVSFNVSSREYNGKYYHNLDAWKIDTLESNVEQPVKSEPVDLTPSDDESGLPF